MFTICLIKLSSIYFMTFQKGYVYLQNINVRLAVVTLYALDKKGNLCTNSLTKTLTLSMVLLSRGEHYIKEISRNFMLHSSPVDPSPCIIP